MKEGWIYANNVASNVRTAASISQSELTPRRETQQLSSAGGDDAVDVRPSSRDVVRTGCCRSSGSPGTRHGWASVDEDGPNFLS